MTLIIFFADGTVFANKCGRVLINDEKLHFYGSGMAAQTIYDLNKLKKIVYDGVTIWEADE